MRKQTLYGKEAREAILRGLSKIAAAVKVTLGPAGRNVLISQSISIPPKYDNADLPVVVTKDGYRVTTQFDLDDLFEKPGVLMAKECAQKTVDQAGDGTTSTIVLLEAIVKAGMLLIEKGANPMELKRDLDKAVTKVITELEKIAIPVKGNIETIRQIATVSANNDSSIGNMIADAFAKIGEEGIIDIEKSSSTKTEIKISDGYKVENGWISPFFVTQREKGICEFQDPLILLYDKRITHHTQVQRALELVIQQKRPILIICEDADEEGLAFIVHNIILDRIQCCVVKSPSIGADRRDQMEDIAILTGGTYMSDLKGVGIKEIEQEHFGHARKIVVSKEETVIIGGQSDADALADLLNELRMNLAQAKNEDEMAPIEKRIARLTGGVAVIHVGANTETEMKERMDRFDDSIRATKSAISEGYVVGGGKAFIHIGSQNPILHDVLFEPFNQICRNAGYEPKPLSSLIEPLDLTMGFNAKTGKVENLIDSGIIDPKKVLRCALENAASAASMILTSECIICGTP